MTKIRLTGPAAEVTELLDVLRGITRLRLSAVSELLPTRGHPHGPRWVRAYLTAALRGPVEPCCGPLAALYVGVAGPLALWACRGCGREWTAPHQNREAP